MSANETTTRLILDGDPSGLVAAMNKARASVLETENGILSIGRSVGAMAAGIGLSGAAVGMLVKSSIDAADNLSKMSQKVGVNIEELSGMAYAAGLADVSTESLAKSMGKLNKAMFEAAGGKGPAETFHALGVSVVDAAGNLRKSDEVMFDIADRFSKMDDGARKTALAMEMFGKSGADMIPLLNGGAVGLREATAEAARFGLVIDREAGLRAEEFNDNLTRFKSQVSGAATAVANELLPAMVDMMDQFAKGGDIENSPLLKGLREMKELATSVSMVKIWGARQLRKIPTDSELASKGWGEYQQRQSAADQLYQWNLGALSERKGGLTVPINMAAPPATPKGKGGGGGGTSASDRAKAEAEALRKTTDAMKIGSEMLDAYYKDFDQKIKEAGEMGVGLVDAYSKNLEQTAKDAADTGSGMVDLFYQNYGKEEQAQFDHLQKMAGMRSVYEEQRLAAFGNESDALFVSYASEQQQAELQMQWEIAHAYGKESEIARIKAEYGERKLAAEQDYAIRQAAIWEQNAQKYLGFAESMTTMGVSLLLAEESQKSQIGARMLASSVRFISQGLQHYMFGKAKEHLINAAGMAGAIKIKTVQAATEMGIGATQAAAWAAYYSAHSLNPYGGQAYAPAAAAMTAAVGGFGAATGAITAEGAVGVAAELGMAAAWAAGGVAVGAVGEAGAGAIERGKPGNAAGYGGGTPYSPVVTQPLVSTRNQGNVTIHIKMENVYGDQNHLAKWAEEQLAPIMRDATTRNIVFLADVQK